MTVKIFFSIIFFFLSWLCILAQDQREVTMVVRYKNDTDLYCGDGNMTSLKENATTAKFWSNVTFYRISGYNTSAQTIEKISPEPKKYVFDSERNILSIKSLMKPDILSRFFCNSSTNSTITFIFKIVPFMYIAEKTKISPIETSEIELSCALLYGNEQNTNNITWKWVFNNQRVIVPTNRLTITNTYDPYAQSKLAITDVTMAEKGNFECQATNEFGQASQIIFVNVKSSLSPLWPFIGVFIEIALFVVILLMFGRDKKKD